MNWLWELKLESEYMLHLLGYDHMDEEDAAIMEPKQEAILNSLNITRE